jgi:hypothetical protein
MLVNMMIDRPHYLERISETVTLEDESPQLLVSTSQGFRVGVSEVGSGGETHGSSPGTSSNRKTSLQEPTQVMLIPLALIEKGTLLDGFTVTDSDGRNVPTLSYNQTRGLLAYVLKTIIDIAPERGHARSGGDRKNIKSKVAAKLVQAACSPGPRKKKSAAERAEINALLDCVDELPVADDWKQRIRGFCDALVDHYVIVAEVSVPAGGYILATYEQAISVDSSASGFGLLRSRLGLRYSKFDIPLNIFALEVDAYHMQMNASPMQYVFDHHLERMNSGIRVTQADLCRGHDKPYLRLHHCTAGPAMHLYIRRQSDRMRYASARSLASFQGEANRPDARERLKSVVEFREIPPGALGAAAIVSVMTAAVIVFFALTRIGEEPFDGSTAAQSGSDIPALILTLPGFASLVIGSWLDLAHLRRASLATYLGLGTSVALSLTAALYYLLDANKAIPGRISLHVASGFVIRTDMGWMGLAVAAVTCSLFLMRDLSARSRYYFSMIEKRIQGHIGADHLP